jgi:hypothetical protein
VSDPGPPLLVSVFPLLGGRLEALLAERGEDRLAAQVPHLRVHAVCACGLEVCGSFHTSSRPMRRWWRRGRQVAFLTEFPGEVVLDVVGGKIVYVEVTGWDDARRAILGAA